MEGCPLITDYAVNPDVSRKMRPFPALDSDLLEKLYIVRKWPIGESPIPFKHPNCLRKTIYDPGGGWDTGEPLILREFQKQAITHLARMPRFFFFGDSIGLGKTLSSLAAFCWLKDRNPKAKLVVVTTKSTVFQWTDEVRRFTTLSPRIMTDTFKGLKSSQARYMQAVDFFESDDADVLIAKYDSLKGVRKKIEGEFDSEGNPVCGKERLSEEIRTFAKIFRKNGENTVLILDEAHKFSGPRTQVRNLIWNLSPYPQRVWALTATAVKNSLEEFYSIASTIGIRPLGFLGDFKEEHCIYREQYVGRGITKKFLVGYKNVAKFKQEMRPFFFGRSQRQVKEPLPELTTIYHPIELDARQTEILTDELPNGTIILPPSIVEVAGEIYEKERDPSNIMTALAVQQAVANHWCLLDKSSPDFHTKILSPKEEALLDLLDGDLRGEKAVVFSKSRTWINRLEWLTKNGYFTGRKFLRITGAEDEKQREENKKLFQDPNSNYDLIVINTAGLEGINLQQAAHMILLDCPWGWGSLIQLVGRMVRMASPHSACTLHVMVARGTIDEYTIETLKGKKGVFEKILGESHSAGILDDKQFLDLESGMEAGGTEEEFKELLRAHVKRFGLSTFLLGDLITEAKGNENYQMSFQKKAGEKKERSRSHDEQDKELEKRWML